MKRSVVDITVEWIQAGFNDYPQYIQIQQYLKGEANMHKLKNFLALTFIVIISMIIVFTLHAILLTIIPDDIYNISIIIVAIIFIGIKLLRIFRHYHK